MAAELAAAAVSEVGSKVAESAYDFICREISYVFKHQSYVEDLKKQVQQLRNKKQRIELDVNHAKRQGEDIYDDVDKWLISVDEFTEGVVKHIEDEEKAKKRCFKGLCPNLIKRYRLSKEVQKATANGDVLLGEGNFSKVSYRPALQRTESIYVRGYEAFDSRTLVLQKIMDALTEANVNMIGVYGMPGVGKTTLVKKVASQAKKDKLFDEVVIAQVTQIPDLKNIQGVIADQLGLTFHEESIAGRADRLRERLKKEKRVLIILDDIWGKVDFDAVGIPFGDVKKGRSQEKADSKATNDGDRQYKILLTSRYQHILCNRMNAQKIFLVDLLNDEEARYLFQSIVGHVLAENPSFQSIAVEVVQKCAGLPIAIVTIANALRNKSLPIWKDALFQLRNSNPRNIDGMAENVCSIIELSYNYLSEEEKSLFRLSGLWAVGHEIHVGDLLMYSMGLGLFRGVFTLEDGRNRLHVLIHNLKASCLLLDGITSDWVKMHDIIHAVAISIASTYECMLNIQNVDSLKEMLQEKVLKDSTAIALSFGDNLTELPESLVCPQLEFFSLYMINGSLQIPNLLFEGMKKLRVLDLTGICSFPLPSSLYCLKNLRTLCLNRCLLGDIVMIGELRELEFLSLARSDLEQLPAEIGRLTQLKSLDLSNCSKLKVIVPGVLSSLARLEELYMYNSFVQWEVEGKSNASLLELKKLSNLNILDMHVLDVQMIPKGLFSQKLQRYRIFIGDIRPQYGKYEISRTLRLKLNYIILENEVKILLKRTKDLYLDELKGVKNVVDKLEANGFPELKHLLVQNSVELLHIVNSIPCKLALPVLESLFLNNLVDLEKICHGQLHAGSFSKLKIIKIKKCDRLKHLFPSFIARNLSHLQEIKVTNCENLQEIFGKESEDHVDQNEMNSEIEFIQLRSLALQELPKLVNFGFDVKAKFPSLENLKLSSINGELDQRYYSQTLINLTVEKCNALKFLLTSSMVESLVQLQNLVICNCKSMEIVIDTEGSAGEERITETRFPKLLYMKLESLPKLTRFGTGNLVEFPSLNELHIFDCSKLKTIFCNSSHAETVKKEPEKLNMKNCHDGSHPLFAVKAGFPSLQKLKIAGMDNLIRIWHDQLALDSFSKLQSLLVDECGKLQNIYPSNMLGRLQRLEEMWVSSCGLVKVIFGMEVLNGEKTGSQLRELSLYDLPNLDHIWNMNNQGIPAVQNLVYMTVGCCKRLKSLFPASVAKDLPQLERLDILCCHSLEEIVAKEEGDQTVPEFVFPKLASLKLQHLPKLRSFYPGIHISKWPVLTGLKVRRCYKVEIFASKCTSPKQAHRESEDTIQQPLFLLDKDDAFPSLEELELDELPQLLHLWEENSQTTNAFHNLITLRVSNCNRLRYLVTFSIATSLAQVSSICITDCKRIEQVITHLGDEVMDTPIAFNKMDNLELNCLPSLTSFCCGDCTLELPSLEKVIVQQCLKMEYFSRGVLRTPKLQSLQLKKGENEVEGCWEGNLNSTIQQLSERENVQSSEEDWGSFFLYKLE